MLKTPYLVFKVIIIRFAWTLGNEGTAYVEQERQRVNGGEFIMPRHQEVAGRGLLSWVMSARRRQRRQRRRCEAEVIPSSTYALAFCHVWSTVKILIQSWAYGWSWQIVHAQMFIVAAWRSPAPAGTEIWKLTDTERAQAAPGYIWAFTVMPAHPTELHFKYSQLRNPYMFLQLWWEAVRGAVISYARWVGMAG